MVKPRVRDWLYIGAVALVAAALALALRVQAMDAGMAVWALAAAMALATYLGAQLMLPFGPKIKLEVSSASLFASALLLPAPLAMAAGAAGHAAAAIRLRRPWDNVLFNGAEVGLRVGVAAAVFGLINATPMFPLLAAQHDLLRLSLGTAAAGTLMYGLNTALVSGMTAIRIRQPFLQVWRRGRRVDAAPEASLLVLGLLAALLANTNPWAVPLLGVPVVAIYFALRDRLAKMELAEKLQQQMQELQRTQVQLVQSGRLASVGTLAAGVAHEINNPMFVIAGNAELLLANREENFRSELAERRVETIYQMAQRVSRIVSSLLNFSRQKDHLAPVSLNEAAEEVLGLVGSSLASRGVTLQREYQPELPPIAGKKSQVEQVMMNLVLNARDAMSQGGSLTVTTWTQGAQVGVSFADTGDGLPPEVKEHLFEPFYTTKEPGKGTGLGLFISRRIVEEHSGEIRAESRKGRGATFTLLFPVAAREPEAPTGPEPEASRIGSLPLAR